MSNDPDIVRDMAKTYYNADETAAANTLTEYAELLEGTSPAPQIIRTDDELEALDPMTVVYTPKRDTPVCAGDFLDDIRYDPDYADDLPAVVVASGEHVRACREALDGGTK